MPLHPSRKLASLLLALLASAVAAQIPTTALPATAPAAAPVVEAIALPTALTYQSALSSYQAYADQPIESWREANDRVGRIGGWRAYAKEIETKEPSANEAPNAAPSVDPHAGHHGGAKP